MSNDMATTDEALAIIERAKSKIQHELDLMTELMGKGWLLDVDIGAIDVTTMQGRAGTWRVHIEAKLSTEARA